MTALVVCITCGQRLDDAAPLCPCDRDAVEAGADPARASERMAQAAQTFALLAPETAEPTQLDAFSAAYARHEGPVPGADVFPTGGV